MSSKLVFLCWLTIGMLAFSACGDSSGENNTSTEPTQVDPNADFSIFESMFVKQELPYAMPYDFTPFGASIAGEVKQNFLPREGELFPAARFPLRDGFRAFVTFETSGGDFQAILNIFKDQKYVGHRLVAGPDGNQVVDVEFREGGVWTETRRSRAEDTGAPEGEGTSATFTIDGSGKVVAQ